MLGELTHDAALSIDALERALTDVYTAALHADFRSPFLPMMLFLLCQTARLMLFTHVAIEHSTTVQAAQTTTDRLRALIALVEGCLKPIIARWDAEATAALEYVDSTKIKMHLAFMHAVLMHVRPAGCSRPPDVVTHGLQEARTAEYCSSLR